MNEKLNSKGFGVIESFLGVIALTVLVGVGFYVINANKDKREQPQSNSTNIVVNQDKDSAALEKLPFTFKYPESWSSKVDLEESNFLDIKLIAPDTEIDEARLSLAVIRGAVIGIYMTPSLNLDTIDKFKSNDNPILKYVTNGIDKTVDGKKVYEYDATLGTHVSHNTLFFIDKSSYRIEIPEEVYKNSEYSKIYNDLIQSIDFK